MAGFIIPKRTIGFKIEGTPYTAEVLAATDYNVKAYNITHTPEIAMKTRKLARGDFSRDVSIAGKRRGKYGFSVDFEYSGTAQTPPSYFKCLEACGLKQEIHGTTGVSLVTDADYSNVPATAEIVEKAEGTSPSQLVFGYHGSMGNAKLVLDNVGEPVRIDFEFEGVQAEPIDRAYGSILIPTGMSSEEPAAVLSAGITLFGEGQQCNTATIDLGNKLEVYTDPTKSSGYDGCRIVDREPTLTLDPDMVLIATQDNWTRWTTNATGAFLMEINNDMQISAPAAQIINDYQPGEREGHVVTTKTLELKRSSGNDELEILQGSKT